MIFFLVATLVVAIALAALISKVSDIMDINKHIKIMKQLCYLYTIDIRLYGEYQRHICEEIYLPNLPPRHKRLEKSIRDKWSGHQYAVNNNAYITTKNIGKNFDMDLYLSDWNIYLPKSLVSQIHEFTLSSCETVRKEYLSRLKKSPKKSNTRKSTAKPNPKRQQVIEK